MDRDRELPQDTLERHRLLYVWRKEDLKKDGGWGGSFRYLSMAGIMVGVFCFGLGFLGWSRYVLDMLDVFLRLKTYVFCMGFRK